MYLYTFQHFSVVNPQWNPPFLNCIPPVLFTSNPLQYVQKCSLIYEGQAVMEKGQLCTCLLQLILCYSVKKKVFFFKTNI